ncbi:MAG: hypothetical protein RLZZ502_723 [Pseudomonadota bacterium]|jgi:hypothetical protein
MSLYLNPHQARKRPPTSYEVLLGDAIERAFAAGHWQLPELVAYLNRSGPKAMNDGEWTEALYQSEIKRLAKEA